MRNFLQTNLLSLEKIRTWVKAVPNVGSFVRNVEVSVLKPDLKKNKQQSIDSLPKI